MKRLFGSLAKLTIAASAMLALPCASFAAPVRIGSSHNPAPVGAFVAADQGYFGNLQVKLKLLSLGSTMPAALVSRSLDVASMSPTTYIRAVDGGLDLVVIAGAADMNPGSTESGIAAQPNEDINGPKDLVGKKVGVPGIGAILHVLTRAWLLRNGVNYKSVHFVEARFPIHRDIMKSKQVDAVVSVDPFLSSMIHAGIAKPLVFFPKVFGAEKPPVNVFVTTRAWAKAHPDKVKAIRAALSKAAAFGNSHHPQLRRVLGQMLKLPPRVMSHLDLPLLDAKVTVKQLDWWIDMMRKQHMLTSNVSAKSLIWP